MKTAKQQAQDLDQTSKFLTSLLSDGRDEKPASPQGENAPIRLVNGKPKLPKLDSVPRFTDPPAPPPQQPLPEKPDISLSSPSETGLVASFKRSETARPSPGLSGPVLSGSPTNQSSSQILSLVEALTSAKKELDTQGARVKHLEDMLRQERTARESAEERARRLEHGTSFKPLSSVEEETDLDPSRSAPGEASVEQESAVASEKDTNPAGDAARSEDNLQSRLDEMVVEMSKMKEEMQKFQQRAEVAQADATSTRASLGEMIERFRQENEHTAEAAVREILPSDPRYQHFGAVKSAKSSQKKASSASSLVVTHQLSMPNGHVRAPSKLPEHLERAMATMLRTDSDGQLLAQSAPYASMLGVVLIGVGLMAYLNSWQKMEK